MSRKSPYPCLLLVLAVLVTTACTTTPKPTTDVVIPLQLSEVIRSIFYAPLYVAISKGFFHDHGLDVTLTTAGGADKGVEALISKSADIALFGPEAAIYVAAQGAKNPIIAFAQLTAKDGSFLVSRDPEPNFKWEDLRGKVIIGGRKGGIPQMTLEYIIKKHGLEPQGDVRIIQDINPGDRAQAFAAGVGGDYAQLWGPDPVLLETEESCFTVASLGAEAGPLPCTVFHATEEYLKENPALIQRFTAAIYEAMLWVKENSTEEVAEAIAIFFPDTEHDVISKTIAIYKELDIWAPNPVLSPESFDLLQDIMILAGELKEKVPYDRVINTTFAQKVMGESN